MPPARRTPPMPWTADTLKTLETECFQGAPATRDETFSLIAWVRWLRANLQEIRETANEHLAHGDHASPLWNCYVTAAAALECEEDPEAATDTDTLEVPL